MDTEETFGGNEMNDLCNDPALAAAAAKSYLGDSVYAEIDRGMVKLTTDNGLGPSNMIYLEPEVAIAFVTYFERWYEAARAHVREVTG